MCLEMNVCINIDTSNCSDLVQKLNIVKKDMVLIIVGTDEYRIYW
jgi:hypothetical protein